MALVICRSFCNGASNIQELFVMVQVICRSFCNGASNMQDLL